MARRLGGLVRRGRCPGAGPGRPRLVRLASWLGAGTRVGLPAARRRGA
jgi:hypothetical protein